MDHFGGKNCQILFLWHVTDHISLFLTIRPREKIARKIMTLRKTFSFHFLRIVNSLFEGEKEKITSTHKMNRKKLVEFFFLAMVVKKMEIALTQIIFSQTSSFFTNFRRNRIRIDYLLEIFLTIKWACFIMVVKGDYRGSIAVVFLYSSVWPNG